MQSRLLRLAAVTFAVAGFLTLSPRTSAETIRLNYQGPTQNPGNPAVQVTLDGQTYEDFEVGPFYWKQSRVPPNPNFPAPPATITTFCLEIDRGQPLPVPGTNTTFSVVPLSGVSEIGNDAGKIAAITELYGRHYNTAWENGTFTGSIESVAFQLALWELLYDGTSNGLGTPRFQATGLIGPNGEDYTGTAQMMLDSLNGDTSRFNTRFAGSELVALLAPGDGTKGQNEIQDQIVLRPKEVPAPPAVMLAGIGMLALLGRARWNRRTPTAA